MPFTITYTTSVRQSMRNGCLHFSAWVGMAELRVCARGFGLRVYAQLARKICCEVTQGKDSWQREEEAPSSGGNESC